MQVALEVEWYAEGLKCWIFDNGILHDIPFRRKLERRESHIMQEFLSKAQSFINLEEKLNTRLDNPITTDANSNLPAGKESHHWKYKFNWGKHNRYDKYSIECMAGKYLLRVCQHIVLKGRNYSPISHQKSSRIDKTKYCCFHRGNNRNTDDSIKLKNAIKGLIKMGWFSEYMNGKTKRRVT